MPWQGRRSGGRCAIGPNKRCHYAQGSIAFALVNSCMPGGSVERHSASPQKNLVTNLVSLRREAERALGDSERRFRLVVEAAPNAMVMVDRNGKITMVNAQAERTFGYVRGELVGQPVEMLMPERFRGHHPDLRAAFLADPKPRRMGAGRDLYAVKKDGE